MKHRYPLEACCFATGHRNLPVQMRPRIQERIRKHVIDLAARGVIHYYAGGASGFDLIFACVILDLKKKLPQLTLHILLPEKYHISLSDDEALAQEAILREADEVRKIPVGDSMLIPPLVRDLALVRSGKYCICYLANNQITPRGGTAFTVRHANEQGREFFLVWRAEDKIELPEEMLNPKGKETEYD